ncbi:uncharacterized protein LOC144160699 [Haemaphysalis longicornis]
MGLEKLAASVKSSKASSLSISFPAKTHKTDCPFRAIVSASGTWQRCIGTCLQKSLSVLAIDDLFLVRHQQEVSDFLREERPSEVHALSVDVQDLYYSLPHDTIFEALRDSIDSCGATKFPNACGISVSGFLEVLELYLQSTFVHFRDQLFVEKKGVCIGSCLTPILSDLVLAQFERKLQEALKLESVVQKVFRFMDDFLTILRAAIGSSAQKVRELYKSFCDALGEFHLTKEEPTKGELQFLDVRLHLDHQHVCWTYAPRSKKALQPHSSPHSKLVKGVVATSSLKNSLSRSCEHTVDMSFRTQIERLRSAGYPEQLLHSAANKIMGDLRNMATKKVPQDEHKKKAVISNVHGVSHNLKKIVGRSGVDLLFSAPNKLGGLCKRVNQEEARKHCTKNHATSSKKESSMEYRCLVKSRT